MSKWFWGGSWGAFYSNSQKSSEKSEALGRPYRRNIHFEGCCQLESRLPPYLREGIVLSTERFHRLPEEKRNRFLSAAWEEFTKTSFSEVSINQIVRKAAIPRGSFYQYFTDKADLFSYLLEGVRQRFTADYHRILDEAKGDLFRAQVICFDHMAGQEAASDPMMKRCIQFMRQNPGLDLQKILPGKPGYAVLDGLWDKLDLTGFRRKDRDYVCQVFFLALMLLGSALMDCIFWPEHRESCREELITRLEILKHGCLEETP